MSDGSLFVDIIPDFSTLKKKAKREKVEVGTTSRGRAGGAPGVGGIAGAGAAAGTGILGSGGALMKMLGKIGIAVFAMGKILEVFKPVIEVIGSILKTLGLLLIPLVRLLLVLLTPVLKWLAGFVSDFLTDPFGAIIRGIGSLFTQLLPELLTGLTSSIVSALETILPSWMVGDGLDVSARDVVRSSLVPSPSGVAALGGGGVSGMMISNLARSVADFVVGRLGNRFGATVNVEGVTDEATASTILNLLNRNNALFGSYGKGD